MVDVREFERAVLCAFETTFADTEEDKEKTKGTWRDEENICQ